MALKLLQAAQDRWRAVNGPHLVALVQAGATFHKGQLVERPADITKSIRTTAPRTTPSTVQEKVAA
jgi:putative transposase